MPDSVLIKTGKNTVDTTSTTFDSIPKPNQMRNIGARAVLGTDCRPITYGYTTVRTGRNSEITSARKNPTRLPRKKPVITSLMVTPRSLIKVPSARLTDKDLKTSPGPGKRAGDTWNLVMYHCQKETTPIALTSHMAKRAAFL